MTHKSESEKIWIIVIVDEIYEWKVSLNIYGPEDGRIVIDIHMCVDVYFVSMCEWM